MSFLGFWYKRPIVIIRNLLVAAQSMPKRLFAILLGQILKRSDKRSYGSLERSFWL